MDERSVDVVCGDHTGKNCAIKLDGVFCDGYVPDASIGVFSHFHDDHTKGLPFCVAKYDVLVAHPTTFEGINALHPGMRRREQWVTQDYDTEYPFSGGKIRLLKANHIPGSSQVYVESGDRTMLYSGDFGYPDIQTRRSDYLVIDSTHGDPWFDGETDRRSVMNRMFEHVEERTGSGNHVAVLVSSGTLQEIVRHFEIGYGRRMRDDIVFVMDGRQDAVLRSIYRGETRQFRDTVEYGSPEFWRVLRDGRRCLVFLTSLDTGLLDDVLDGFYKVIVDRYRFGKGAPIHEFEGGCRFNLAAHASINGIYRYVEDVGPKYVVTDGSRSNYARQLAKLIEQRFPNIRTECRPPHRPS